MTRDTQQYQKTPPIKRAIQRSQPTVTAAPRSPTPPPLFCFFLLLRVRLLLRWWPRESECERAVHRPHTHASFSLSVCVFCFTGVMRVCVRWSSHASAFCFVFLFDFVVECTHSMALFY
ncbi:hypothetical protein TCDM_13392 [Trypanosoma cruzi Dm28c]|uniref:Mucin TcMUCII n=1 Tax=Trypanosoma cruzi Dm28c TaxID=1416333 RepID=V5ASV8_TRYCR|nr:hypothetical protein TCDM_13392 [Trypanosoma cruzi Dm28c]